jgi:hypothetical protein
MTIERTDPPTTGDEMTLLRGFLAYHRDTLRTKTEGLDAAALAAVLPPSDMTLGGMLKHVALNEDWWFSCILLGAEHAEPWVSVDWDADVDWDWHSAVDDTPEHLHALFDDFTARSDAIIARVGDLDAVSARPSRRTGELFTLRWILLHMIEEYARHNGHADLIRQSIDGVTGE